MALAPGTRLGPYEIAAPIGAGGMGEVYKARDTRLDRTVAIKILPSADPEKRRRFASEAKAIAALSHPHICVLHDVGELVPSIGPSEPIDFIVMEYLEGETLADRLTAGTLPLEVLLEVATQVADALDAAHGARVIHRDLKPQNIFITRRGQAKVLDFGIAKLGPAPADADPSARTQTASATATGPGTVLGTLAYMSPEQARGDEVDARSDVFSFGAVLYEMATGRPPFTGRTTAALVDALLNKPPASPRSVIAGIPQDLEAVINRALDKDRSRRYQSAAELRTELEGLRAGRVSPAAPPPVRTTTARRASVAAALVVGVVALGLAWWRPWGGDSSAPIDSIAVLPFVNDSETPDTDYLSDGLAEALTNSLTRVPGLRVVPRTLAAKYKDQTMDPRQAGQALNARAVVTGRVRQRGDRFTVQAELIDAATVAQLWGDRFDRPLDDVIDVQADIARAIADNLRLRLTREDRQRLTAGAPTDAAAYQLYLRGRFETGQRTRDGYAAAAGHFEQAIALDPTYARAYAGLADVYLWQGYWGYLPSAGAYSMAMAAAQRALALDEQSADAHASLGWLNLYHLWNWPESERRYLRALELDPTSAFIYAWYGESLSTRGRHDQAIAEVRQAAALDPLSPQIKTSLAFVLSNARQYDEAIEMQKAAAAGSTSSTLAHLDLARLYRLSGQYALAIATSERMIASGDPLGPSFLASSYARTGRRVDALAIVKTMEDERRRSGQGSFLLGMVYAALGDRDRAFQWLEAAFKERDTFLPWLKVDPEFDPLRGDPRFDDLTRRIGIPDR